MTISIDIISHMIGLSPVREEWGWGKTTFLTGLSDPLEIFMSASTNRKTPEYREAIFFPISEDYAQTTQGAVIFMK
ncbi:MAG: hypothetical protein PHP26_10890 [Syntrophomonas sp.]|nr:hypothetical protein [Syntrophomonas sp.]